MTKGRLLYIGNKVLQRKRDEEAEMTSSSCFSVFLFFMGTMDYRHLFRDANREKWKNRDCSCSGKNSPRVSSDYQIVRCDISGDVCDVCDVL